MDFQIILGLVLTVLPIVELRGGLPVVVEYCLREGVSIWPYFLLVLLLNILVILVIFAFFDFLHESFMGLKIYRKFIGRRIEKVQHRKEKLRKRMEKWGYLALLFFVAIPLPGTGAWTGTLIAWVLGLDRSKSFVAIAAGVIVAGLLILLASLGFFVGLY